MKVTISVPKPEKPQEQCVLGELDGDDFQFNHVDRSGTVSGPSVMKLVTLLGDGYGTRGFQMQIGDAILSGCRIVRHSSSLTFRYSSSPSRHE